MRLKVNKHHRTVFVILFIIVISACKREPQPPPATDPPPTTQAPTAIPDTLTPTPIPPTVTPPAPTTTPTPNPCPAQQSLTPPSMQAFAQYPDNVNEYLTKGGNPVEIVLGDWEGYLSADLTGDRVSEHIYVFNDPSSAFFPPASIMVIYQCHEGAIKILEVFEPQEWWGLELIDARDITQNGKLDLLFSEVTCGAHTCWHTLHALTWSGAELKDTVGAEFSYPYPDYLFDNYQLIVVSNGIGSAGAGPQRPITTTLAWNGSVVTTTNTTIGPAKLRFHTFVDGDTALYAGQFDISREFYIRVIEEAGLESWPGFYTEDEESEWLYALAQWRLLNLSSLQGDFDTTEEYYDTLRENISFKSPVYPVVLLSERYWDSLEAGNSVNHACSVVQAMPETLFTLDFLNSYGYANPNYKAVDLCISFSD